MNIERITDTGDENLEERIQVNPIGIRLPTVSPANIPVPTIMAMPFGAEMRVTHKRKSLKPRNDNKRIIHYSADYAGCGWWRFGLLEQIANYSQKAHIMNTSILVDPFCESFWNDGIKAVRIQRQVTNESYRYFRDLRRVIEGRKLKTRLIYEIDDIVIGGLMPSYNLSKMMFERDHIQRNLKDNIMLCDEFTVCSKYMKELYQDFVPSANITVIPNYATKAWFGHIFDRDYNARKFEENRKRPRVLLSCSGSHYVQWDINPYNENDYSHVSDDIISSRKDFEYVWLGTYPNVMKPFIESGEMVHVGWSSPMDFPWIIKQLGCQVSIAALADNDFNKAKSSIKYQEACYAGLPFVGQNIECYKMAPHLFNTGAELVDQIKSIVADETIYMNEVDAATKAADAYWMDDKIDDILKIYDTPFADPTRNAEWFVKVNY